MKVGRVAIITRGRYAGKKVRLQRLFPAIDMHMIAVAAKTLGERIVKAEVE